MRRGMLVLVLIAVAFAEWLLVPSPPLPGTQAPAEEPWKLAQLPKAQPKSAVEVLNRVSLWGKLPEPEAQKPLEWRFLGVVAHGKERYVLIKIEGQPEQQLKVGDTLPGGSRILKIEDDALGLLTNGRKHSVGIHQKEPLIL